MSSTYMWKNVYKDRSKVSCANKTLLHNLCQLSQLTTNRRVNQLFAILIKLPELKDSVELLDVATPYTFNRYVNTSNGVFMSFFFTHKDPMFSHHGQLKGLKNFYLSGQWMQGPGGLPIAMTQGKFAIQRICKRLGTFR